MSDPTSAAEYEARYHAHQKVTGFGIDGMRIHVPCPFCAAADFLVHSLLDMERKFTDGATCKECGRSARGMFGRDRNAVSIGLVQTGGPDPAPWVAWIRRQTTPPPAPESDPADKSLEG